MAEDAITALQRITAGFEKLTVSGWTRSDRHRRHRWRWPQRRESAEELVVAQ